MGSWNQTCMVTQVPVTYETKVKFFMLRGDRWFPMEGRKRKDYGTTSGECYTHNLWKPFIPFDGVYDTYGAVEKWRKTDPAFNVVEGYFQKNHDMKMKAVLGKIHSDESFHLRSGGGANDCELFYCYGFAMVPTEIYNGIVQANSLRHDWRSKDVNVGDSFLATLKEVVSIHKNDKEYIPGGKLGEDYWFSSKTEIALEKTGHAFRLLKDTVLKNELIDLMCENEENIELVHDFLLFHDAMQELRVGYMPQCGQGSQDTEFDLHRMKANLAIAYCCNQERRNEE